MQNHLYEVISEKHPFRMGTWIVKKGRTMHAVVDKEKWWGAKMVGYTKLFREWKEKGYVKLVTLTI